MCKTLAKVEFEYYWGKYTVNINISDKIIISTRKKKISKEEERIWIGMKGCGTPGRPHK